MNPQLAINILKFYGKIKNVGFYLLLVPRIEAFALPTQLNEQRRSPRRYVYTSPNTDIRLIARRNKPYQ